MGEWEEWEREGGWGSWGSGGEGVREGGREGGREEEVRSVDAKAGAEAKGGGVWGERRGESEGQ